MKKRNPLLSVYVSRSLLTSISEILTKKKMDGLLVNNLILAKHEVVEDTKICFALRNAPRMSQR